MTTRRHHRYDTFLSTYIIRFFRETRKINCFAAEISPSVSVVYGSRASMATNGHRRIIKPIIAMLMTSTSMHLTSTRLAITIAGTVSPPTSSRLVRRKQTVATNLIPSRATAPEGITVLNLLMFSSLQRAKKVSLSRQNKARPANYCRDS